MSVLSALPMVVLPLAEYGPHHGGWPWVFAPLFFLLWLGIAFLVFRCFWRGGGPRPRSGVDRAKDILAERYAKGELSSDEFRERLDQLH